MDAIRVFWAELPASVHLLLGGLSIVFVISLFRFGRLTRYLYRTPDGLVSPEGVVKGESDPDLLAASALASRVPCDDVLQRCSSPEAFTDKVSAQEAIFALKNAENRFLYLWAICHSDVGSIRRASMFSVLLSALMLVFGAWPIYRMYSNESRLSDPVPETVLQLLAVLKVGLLVSAILYLGSNFFDRTIANRRTCWIYFSERLKNHLLRVGDVEE